MIQPAVQEVASVFRGELRRVFDPYPALIPDVDWPSVGVLDALCRGMRDRGAWTDVERLFIAGAAAHIGELIDACWQRLSRDVRVEHERSVVCSAKGADGKNYRLPLEDAILAVLDDPGLAQRLPRDLPFGPSSGRHVLELFVLTASLGMSWLGKGRWRKARVSAVSDRIDAVIPFLAETCARHYWRMHPEERLGREPDLYRGLIWPLTLCDGADAYAEAGAGLLARLEGGPAGIEGALPLLTNLARSPCGAVRGAALTCLILDERVTPSGDLVEIAAEHVHGRAPAYRAAAIGLAAAHGRNIDWLNGGENAAERFRHERRLSLLPLVYLPFEACIDPASRELTSALVAGEAEEAARLIGRRVKRSDRPAEFVFQQAMLKRWMGDPEAAEALLARLLEAGAARLGAELYLEAGLSALALDRIDEAIWRLERAREVEPRRYRVASALGRAYARAGRHEEAAAAFAEAIALGHAPSDALVSRADVRLQMGEHEGYARDLAAAAALNPFNPRVVEKVVATYMEA